MHRGKQRAFESKSVPKKTKKRSVAKKKADA